MSSTVVGYEGEGKARRPIRRDLGPAVAITHGTLEATGRLSVPVPPGEGAQGAGPIERRQITEAERETYRERGRKGAKTSPWRHPETQEGPVSEPAADHSSEYSTPARASFPVELVTPCDGCLHRVVCAIRLTLDPLAFRLETIEELDDALTVTAPVHVSVDCAHFLAAPAVPQQGPTASEAMVSASPVAASAPAPRPQRPRQPGHHAEHPGEVRQRDERAARVVAALERHGGDRRAAAADLGMKVNALVMVAKHARIRAEGGA